MALREQLAGKTAAERAEYKAAEVVKVNFRGRFARMLRGEEFQVEVLNIRRIESKGRAAVEVTARAFRNGRAVGFGKDGTVEIERLRIFNPPLLVDDPAGDIVQQFTNEDGVTRSRRLREDPAEAIRDTLAQIVRTIGKPGDHVIRGRVGNTTSTFFPDAHTESTSVDGRASRQANESFAAIVSGAGTHSQDSAPGPTFEECVRLRAGGGFPNFDRCSRGFFLFDTSALPDTDTVDSATLELWIYGKTDSGGWAPNIGIYASTPASNTAIVASDYAQVGSTLLATELSYASITVDAYNAWTLNSTGLAAITPTGVSKFATRSDIDATATIPANSGELLINCHFADTTGTSTDPMLVVEHSAGGSTVDLTGLAREVQRANGGTLVQSLAVTGTIRSAAASRGAALLQAQPLGGAVYNVERLPGSAMTQTQSLAGSTRSLVRSRAALLSLVTSMTGTVRQVERGFSATLLQSQALSGRSQIVERLLGSPLVSSLSFTGGRSSGAGRLPGAPLGSGLALLGSAREIARLSPAVLSLIGQILGLQGLSRTIELLAGGVLTQSQLLAGTSRALERGSGADLLFALALEGRSRGAERVEGADLLQALTMVGELRHVERLRGANLLALLPALYSEFSTADRSRSRYTTRDESGSPFHTIDGSGNRYTERES